VIFTRGTTTQVRAQKELHESCEQLRGAEQLVSVGTLSTSLAQELTQLLSVIRLADQTALAELKKLNCPDDAIRQDLEASVAASATIAAVVSRFRDYARQSAKTKETEMHIDRVAEWTIRLLEQSAQRARVTFRTEHLDALPAIHMRENELEQVFFALAQNAIQAADGNKDCCLLIAGALRGDGIELRFEDNCGGIDPVNLPKIFEPFFTTKPPGKGIGLGLTVAHRIVQHRGGQISVQDRHGQGVTFVVTLPVH
jgi:two-component system C4-dicarboxylate transport sensor histidine kinase DctB